MTADPSWLATRLIMADLLPDALIRAGVRRVIAARLREEGAFAGGPAEALRRAAAARGDGPIARSPSDEHPEAVIPDALYHLMLGRQRKLSAALWDASTTSLDDAEDKMLALTAARAGLADGQRILDLGCGWGALALWMARRFPAARVTAVSSSRSQTEWVEAQARREGLARVEVVTADMNDFDPAARFDRVVSVEMFEDMRNWRALLARVARWLDDDGRAFLQILTRRDGAPPPREHDGDGWLTATFLDGASMPAARLLYAFQDDLVVADHWQLSGVHYRRTVEAWLANLDRRKPDVMRALRSAHGHEAHHWWVRLRVFFLTCAEWWDWRDGGEWFVSQYALTKPARGRAAT